MMRKLTLNSLLNYCSVFAIIFAMSVLLFSCTKDDTSLDDDPIEEPNNEEPDDPNNEDPDDPNNEDPDDEEKELYVHGELYVINDPLFPYTITEDIYLTVDIDLGSAEPMNNRQLGINSTLLDAFVSSSGYNSSNSQNFISWYDPSVMRFPNGVYGNFYKWDTDNRYLPYVDSPTDKSYYGNSQPYWNYSDHESAGNQNYITLGVDGLVTLQKQLVYDILWIWCMNHVDATMSATYTGTFNESDCRWYDSTGKSYTKYEAAAYDTEQRYIYYTQSLGTTVDCVELGNEPFFATQRSPFATASYYNYTTSALTNILNRDMDLIKTIADKLRSLNPNIKLAAPFSWRRGTGNSVSVDASDHYSYNLQYANNISDAYDAMVLHKYVKPSGFTTSTVAQIFTVRQDYDADFKYFRQFHSDKEIWMTEWSLGIQTDDSVAEGVSGSDSISNKSNAASALALADLYLFLFDQDYLTHVEYFQAHGATNPFFVDLGSNASMTMTKTGFGATFEILKDMFTDCTKFDTTLEGAPLFAASYDQQWNSNGSTHTLDAVYGLSAKAVLQADGTYALLIVNKTNRECMLDIKFNGGLYDGEYVYEYLNYTSVNQERAWLQTDEVLTEKAYQPGDLVIFPYSITKISGFEMVTVDVNASENSLSN